MFKSGETWKKKSTASCFDVTMGSYDGAEICELVENLERLINKDDMGLYRDDGLIVLRAVNKQRMDNVRKEIINIFKCIGFKIQIEINLKQVNFLDGN